MALLCLVRTEDRWYCADKVICSSSPEGERTSRIGEVFYENDAPVLRGDRLCGGPMDIQAASDAGGRPSQQVSVTGPSVEGFYRALGARTRCASISSNARP